MSVVVVCLAGGSSDPDSHVATGVNGLMVAIWVGLLVMAGRQWRKRPKRGEDAVMPGWMTGIESVSPVRAVGLGLALSAANPKNRALTMTASASIARAGLDSADQTIAVATFVAIGSVTVVSVRCCSSSWLLVGRCDRSAPLVRSSPTTTRRS